MLAQLNLRRGCNCCALRYPEVDPELLPALLRELARMKKERAAAEEEDYFVRYGLLQYP